MKKLLLLLSVASSFMWNNASAAFNWAEIESAAKKEFFRYEKVRSHIDSLGDVELGITHLTVISVGCAPGCRYQILVTQEYRKDGATNSFSTVVNVLQTPGQVTQTYSSVRNGTKVISSDQLLNIFFDQ